MVDRDRAPERRIGAAPAADGASFRDTESHDTPVPRRPRGALFPVEDSNSDGETRKLQGYALDQLLVASLEGPAGSCPERAHDPSLEFAEASWPDDLALEDHPALVDDEEDVVTQAGPLRPSAYPAPLPGAAALAGDDATTHPDPARASAPSLPPPEPRMSRDQLPSVPPDGSTPWSNEHPRAEPAASVGAALRPADEPSAASEAAGPSRAMKVLVFTGMTALGGALAAFLYAEPQRPRPAAPITAASVPAPSAPAPSALAPPLPAPEAPSAEPSASAAPSALAAPTARPMDVAASTDDTAALEALAQLRDGIGTCVREGIGTLPGSSPAVPRLLTMTRAPGFITLRPDWSSALWGCARFRLSEPMRFQLQWQVVKLNVEGLGVAWIDHDGDGAADRAFAFRATAGQNKGEVTLGEITPIEASHPVLPVR